VGEVDHAGEAYRKAEAVNQRGAPLRCLLINTEVLMKGNQLKEAKEHWIAVELTPNVRAGLYRTRQSEFEHEEL